MTTFVDNAKGSFLLQSTDDESEASKIAKIQLNNDKTLKMNEIIGKELISLRDKQLGPNVSVFYKQDGGVVITEGKDTQYIHHIMSNMSII